MKFEIFQSEKNQKYFFNLKAGNGQVILSSQGYAQKAGAKNGIESVRKNSQNDACFERKEAANGKVFFTLCSTNKQIIGKSQMYASKSGMENGIASVAKNAPEAVIDDKSLAK